MPKGIESPLQAAVLKGLAQGWNVDMGSKCSTTH